MVIKSEVVEKIPRDKKVIFGSIAGYYLRRLDVALLFLPFCVIYQTAKLDGSVISSVAPAMVATTLFHPLDMIKVRLQVYDLSKSTMQMVRMICKCEGCSTMYVGLTAGIMRQATYTATRLAAYYWLYDQYKLKNGKDPNLKCKVFFGCCAGLAGAFVGNPSEVALVRLMADGQRHPCGSSQQGKRYRGAIHAIYKIIRYESVFALWRGGVLTLARSVFLSTVQIGTYAKVREALRERNVAKGLELHFYTSTISSFLAALISLPADVIKTKYQVRSDNVTQWQIVVDVHRTRGMLFFWKGFYPYFIRMALHTFVTYYVMEGMCKMYRQHEIEKKGKA